MNVDALAAQVRQSVQGCTSHLAGPVLAYRRCIEEVGSEALPAIGAQVIAQCEARIAALAEVPGDHSREVWREQLVIEFVAALYGVVDPEPAPLVADPALLDTLP